MDFANVLVIGLDPAPRHADPSCMPTADEVATADRNARHWEWPQPGEIRPGSDQHRDMACAMFRETFNPYKPAVIEWPVLEPDALHRLTSLPIWDIAVTTEDKARARMQGYADTAPDPAWRRAIAQNAWEEGRHREVLSHLVATYGIKLAPEPPDRLPAPEWGYLVTGFSECIDSFFAFGLFELARRSGFFPMALVDTFEPVIQEEARHILLFANWLAWHRARLPLWRRITFELTVIRAWIFLAWERIGLARSMDSTPESSAPDNNFTVTGSQAVSGMELSPLALMEICLTENDRRFSGYDLRLRRPTTTPALARLAIRLGRLFRPRAGRAGAEPVASRMRNL